MTGTRLWVVRGIVLVLVFLAGVMVGSTGSEPAGTVATTPDTYTCSMHPNVQQPEPGLCPLCGMDLIPNTTQTAAASDRIVLSDRARALARLRTTPVRRQADATADVRLLGRIEPDERSRRNVTTWIGGRIDRLTVNTTGESVGRGRVIATLYSPEVYSAHQDLIAARRQVERLKDSPSDARALAEARINYTALRSAPTEDVIATLVAVPGIGAWTAEIYAMFSLGRADVFAPGDLALQEAARVLFDLPERPKERALRDMACDWSPWRSVAARLLWAYYRVAKNREGIR